MKTLILQCDPRKATAGNTWTLEVIGPDGPAKDEMKEAIRTLEHHPAKAARRSLIDAFSLIQQFGYEIKFTEHYYEEELEAWSFILQKR
jgi:hypothetical protein